MSGKTREGGAPATDAGAFKTPRPVAVARHGSPVFLYAGFRTASTWLWSRFRANPSALAYYEFFHEQLGTVQPRDIPRTNSKAWNSHHPDTPPYWIEYLPLIGKEGGLEGYSPDMAFKGFVPVGGLEGDLRKKEREFVASLIRQADPLGKTPVLADNRILGRISALKRAFGGTHIVLYRNLFQQWNSFSSIFRQGNGYFIDTVKWIIENGGDDEFLQFLATLLAFDRKDAARWFEAMDTDEVFAIFVALHVYLFAHARRHADILVGVNELAADSMFRAGVERTIAEKTGISVDLSSVRNTIDAPAGLIRDRDATAIRIEILVGRGLEVLNASPDEVSFARSMVGDMWAEQARFQFYAAPVMAVNAKGLLTPRASDRQLAGEPAGVEELSEGLASKSDEIQRRLALVASLEQTIGSKEAEQAEQSAEISRISAEYERLNMDLQAYLNQIAALNQQAADLRQDAEVERSERLRKEAELAERSAEISRISAEYERRNLDFQACLNQISALTQQAADLRQGLETERGERLRKDGELAAVERHLAAATAAEVALRVDLSEHIKLVTRLGSELETAKSAAAQVAERERQIEADRARQEAADELLAAVPVQTQQRTSSLVRLAGAVQTERRRAVELAAAIARAAENRTRLQTSQREQQWTEAFADLLEEVTEGRRRSTMATLEAVGAAIRFERDARQERWLRYCAQAKRRRFPVTRRNRPSRFLDRVLFRFGPVGGAAILARSGLWSSELRVSASASNTRAKGTLGYAASGGNPAIHACSLFDQEFYLNSNPDMAGRRIPPLVHYIMHGDAEGRSPHPLFSTRYYRANNTHGLNSTGLTALQHFLAFGAAEGRNPHPLFDVRHYVGQVKDFDLEAMNPLVHYLRIGWRRGLDPHPLFANDWYLQRYPDVAAVMMPPLLHYIGFGAAEGRDPHPLFFSRWYQLAYEDVAKSGINPLEHFLAVGAAEQRNPNPYFSTGHYLSQMVAPMLEGVDPLTHYIEVGAWSGYSSHPDLDPAAVLPTLQEAPRPRRTPLEIWIEAGAKPLPPQPERANSAVPGQRPVEFAIASPPVSESQTRNWEALRSELELLFDAAHYRKKAGSLLETSADELDHYLTAGWRLGLDPHPLFSNNYYLQRYPDLIPGEEPPLVHFIAFGAAERRNPHPLFDTAWYCRTYPDVAASGENPLLHFIAFGAREGRSPSPHFNSADYLKANPDVAAAGMNPLVHFMTRWPLEMRQGWMPPEGAAAADGVDAALWLVGRSHELAQWVETNVEEIRRTLRGETAPLGNPLFTDLVASGRPRAADDAFDLPAYRSLTEQLRIQRGDRMAALDITAPKVICIEASDFVDTVANLNFARPDKPSVSIVIPVYNNIKFTLECLVSLDRAGGLREAEIIVIDDGSGDETARLVQGIAGVRYIHNSKNLGFLLTCNRAAKEAKGDVLVFLNNDTQVAPGWLGPLTDALASDPAVGAVAPKLIFPNGRLQEAGALIDPEGRAELIGVFDDPNAPRYNYPREVDYASGACLAVRRSDFESLSGFDTYFAPAYCEDADLCFRLRARGRKILYVPDSVVIHHLSVSSNSVAPKYKSRLAVRNQQRFVERWSEQLEKDNKVRVVSFYLPQFHAIPENDRWWGAGFTEWTNVARALPNYRGHYQPHRPSELGFYDLSDAQVMEKQADLAKKYGVYGFCYYYYWFSGRRVLEKPIERLLKTGKPDLPFALCWANENWTRTWDGQETDVLLAQKHLPDDGENFIKDIAPWLRMENYIRINGKPLLVVYRPGLVPDVERVADQWRAYARANGIGDLYLAFVETFEHARTFPDPAKYGFDATIEFPPAGTATPMQAPGALLNPEFTGLVNDYHELVRTYMREPVPGHTRFRGVMPSWDNTARRQDRSYMYHHASPGAFQAWLEAVFEETRRQNSGDERMVFVNAWNEWAEGAHLEPDIRFGHGWLEAVRNAHDAQRLVRR